MKQMISFYFSLPMPNLYVYYQESSAGLQDLALSDTQTILHFPQCDDNDTVINKCLSLLCHMLIHI